LSGQRRIVDLVGAIRPDLDGRAALAAVSARQIEPKDERRLEGHNGATGLGEKKLLSRLWSAKTPWSYFMALVKIDASPLLNECTLPGMLILTADSRGLLNEYT